MDVWEEPGGRSIATQPAFSAASALPVVLAVTVILGVWLQYPGLGLLLAIIVGPPLVMTYVKSWVREAQIRRASDPAGIQDPSDLPLAPPLEPLTSAEKQATFLKGVMVTTATVAGTAFIVISVAAIFALVMLVSMIAALAQICGLWK